MNRTEAVKDDSTIIMTILSPLPSFFFFETSTPKGFTNVPSLPIASGSTIPETSEGLEGGDGGRPASVIQNYK